MTSICRSRLCIDVRDLYKSPGSLRISRLRKDISATCKIPVRTPRPRRTTSPAPTPLSPTLRRGLSPSLRSSQADPYRDDYPQPSPSPNNSTALLPTSASPAPGASYGTEKTSSAGEAVGKRPAARLASSSAPSLHSWSSSSRWCSLCTPRREKTPQRRFLRSWLFGGFGLDSGSSGGGGGGTGGKVVGAVSGGDGSTVDYGLADPENPFASGAKPNSWTPALNESWTWGVDHVYGVNLGGWFVLEPFIAPALFQAYPAASDEWSLSTLMRADGTLEAKMEAHYDTFITEQDIAQIAGAGLNWHLVRHRPSKRDGTVESEPFLEGVCGRYIVRLFGWAKKSTASGVNLDLHTVPGSQNGYNHSGKGGQINFLNASWASRTPSVRLTTFGSSPSFYLEAYTMIRAITGLGAGQRALISIHDGFHGNPQNAPIATSEDPSDAGGQWPRLACTSWASSLNNSRSQFGVTVAGEWSNGYNDCGLYLNGVNGSHSYGGDCSLWEDSSTWNATVKAGVQQFALASMDALGDWFFWTWKIGKAADGVVRSPLWSYQLGLEGGWMPTDPRTALGKCSALDVNAAQFDGTYSAWQTGGKGAGTIDAAATDEFGVWPPATISGVDAGALTLLPTYTATGSVPTLVYVTPTPSVSPSVTPTASAGNGWFDCRRYDARCYGCGWVHVSGGVECPGPTCANDEVLSRVLKLELLTMASRTDYLRPAV
ncbi:glycoside hydrolase family 5 protein [Mycena olivaceomarginata]|nr:glycoside hydrolase family 5 protein [Mycena olivaceomarginata]